MSTFNEIDIACEECGEEFKGTIWTAIHAAEDAELKDILLGGELNIVMCPKCAHLAYQEHFVLYQDPLAELVAYIYPPAQRTEEDFLRKSMIVSFKDAQDIYPPHLRKDFDPLLIFGLETFVEMMEQEKTRGEQSQIAEVICKENQIPYTLLRPSEARKLGSVRVLPGAPAGRKPTPSELQAGLDRLLAVNPALDLYVQLRESLSAVEK